MDMDILRRVRRLEIASRKAANAALTGQYHSRFKGRGIAFAEVRPYVPGDEVRTIDWNVTARTGEPHVKVFTEERELTVMLLLDVSESGSYGSKDRSKREIAAEVCAHLAISAMANGDRVGLILFSDRVESVVAPRRGRRHAMRLLTEVMSHAPAGRGTRLEAGLEALERARKKTSIVFLISDFQADGYERALKLASRRHDLVPVVIQDAAECELPRGLVELEDPESGERLLLDASDPGVRNRHAQWVASAEAERAQLFKRLELDVLTLTSGEDPGAALWRLFERRARRGQR